MKKNIIAIVLLGIFTTGCYTNQISEWVADISLATTVKVGEINTVTLSYKVPSLLTAPPAYLITREQLENGTYKVYAAMCNRCGLFAEPYYIPPGGDATIANPVNSPIMSMFEFTEPPMNSDRSPVVVEATYNKDTKILSANFKYKAVSLNDPSIGRFSMGGIFFCLPAGVSLSNYQQARWIAGSGSNPITIIP